MLLVAMSGPPFGAFFPSRYSFALPVVGTRRSTRKDAARWVVIVTDDNPRSENAAAIRAEILAGIERDAAGASVQEIGDRREAIRAAVRAMQAGDVVLVAGKGHETGQIVGDTVLPFSDRDELTAALDEVH